MIWNQSEPPLSSADVSESVEGLETHDELLGGEGDRTYLKGGAVGESV
jgi:hypothetical protein